MTLDFAMSEEKLAIPVSYSKIEESLPDIQRSLLKNIETAVY
jgi:hypothetical protein